MQAGPDRRFQSEEITHAARRITTRGRPAGAANQRTRAIADQAAAEGLTPLDVMLRAMREHATAERWDEAAKVAAMAAPFIHPRLATVAMAHDVADPLADFLRHMEGRCRGIPGGLNAT